MRSCLFFFKLFRSLIEENGEWRYLWELDSIDEKMENGGTCGSFIEENYRVEVLIEAWLMRMENGGICGSLSEKKCRMEVLWKLG